MVFLFKSLLLVATGAYLAFHLFEIAIYTLGFTRTRQFYGTIPKGTVRKMFEVDTLRHIGATLGKRRVSLGAAVGINGLVFVVAVAFWIWLDFLPFLLFGLAWVVSVALYLENCALPPLVLFLASSHDSANELFDRLYRSFFPLKVAALLDPVPMIKLSGPEKRNNAPRILLGSYRTTDDEAWTRVVDYFMRLVPVIVVDARRASPLVQYEVNQLFEAELTNKVLVVVAEKAARSKFEESLFSALSERDQWRIVTVETLTDVLSTGPMGHLGDSGRGPAHLFGALQSVPAMNDVTQ